jgi:hypothetical protein
MKQYFTKYLPVEGEIQDGDKALDSNILSDNKIVTISINQYGTASDGRGTYSTGGFKKLKKVKLFLCSRDIQVGDTIKATMGLASSDRDQIVEDIHDTWYDCTDHDVLKQYAYKVVGEISPAAIWIKEGDQLAEEDLQFWHDKEGEYGFVVDPKVRPDWLEWVNQPIKIKCPTCGTFH